MYCCECHLCMHTQTHARSGGVGLVYSVISAHTTSDMLQLCCDTQANLQREKRGKEIEKKDCNYQLFSVLVIF